MAIHTVETRNIVIERDDSAPTSRVLVGAALESTLATGREECPSRECALRGEAFFHLESNGAAANIARISCAACVSPEIVDTVASELDDIASSVVQAEEQSA